MRFCPQVAQKSSKTPPKPFPKWSEMGSKINLFSNLPKKSFFGFYLRNNHIPTVLGRPFFTLCPVIFLQKRGLRTGTPTNHSKFVFFWPRCKIVPNVADTPVPGRGRLAPFSHLFTTLHPLGPKGVPGSPFSLILSWIFIHFVMDFHSFCHGFSLILSCIWSAIKQNLILILLWKTTEKSHTVQNQAEFRVKNFPGNPEKKTR